MLDKSSRSGAGRGLWHHFCVHTVPVLHLQCVGCHDRVQACAVEQKLDRSPLRYFTAVIILQHTIDIDWRQQGRMVGGGVANHHFFERLSKPYPKEFGCGETHHSVSDSKTNRRASAGTTDREDFVHTLLL
jgi:hypothetical protein